MLQVNNVNLEVGNAVLLHNINITLELGKYMVFLVQTARAKQQCLSQCWD